MKVLLRVLGFLLGLIYRLLVLALFERWIPFSARAPEGALQLPTRPPVETKPMHAPQPVFVEKSSSQIRKRPIFRTEPAFFDAGTVDSGPGRAAVLASEPLWLPQPPTKASTGAAAGRPLRVLVRDRRALASAIVLGEALRPRRSRV